MTSLQIGFGGIGILLALLALRMPIGIAMIAVSGAGIWVLFSMDVAYGVLRGVPYNFVSSWTLSAIPMFLFMGYICASTGMTQALFSLARKVLNGVPGSLGVATIAACSGFASVCGSSLACAAAMGRIAVPEMMRAGYDRNFACGMVAAGGTIGVLIPPSIVLILFGIFAQVSIVELFIGGFLVGILSAVGYILLIVVLSLFRPDIVPRTFIETDTTSWREDLVATVPIILLVLGVFGGLFSGLFTTTEAGAVGAGLSILIALAQRRLNFGMFREAVVSTVETCGTLFIVGVGAAMFTQFLSLSGTGAFISEIVDEWGLSYWSLMLIVVLVYLLLGLFMETIGAMLITLPIFLPLMDSAGVDLIFYGLITAKLIEIGMITPPLGINVFAIKSVVGDAVSLAGIFKGVVLFFLVDLAVVGIIIAFPDLIMWLPRMFRI